MIKIDGKKGIVKIKGDYLDSLTNLSMLVEQLKKMGIHEEEIRSAVDMGLGKKDYIEILAETIMKDIEDIFGCKGKVKTIKINDKTKKTED